MGTEKIQKVIQFAKKLSTKKIKISTISKPKQNDGHSCGVIVLLNLIKILTNRGFETKDLDLKFYRLYFTYRYCLNL